MDLVQAPRFTAHLCSIFERCRFADPIIHSKIFSFRLSAREHSSHEPDIRIH